MKDCQIGKMEELTVMPLMVREFACSKRSMMIFLRYACEKSLNLKYII
ncbi:hypothetical protein [Clostridium acidisoli]|nr:hypothetical protein [Clostridium acidisoli]